MAKRQRSVAPPEYDLTAALSKLAQQRPQRVENRLIFVPSLKFMGRNQPEDIMEDGVSFRNPHEFLEWAFPDDAPIEVYPFTSDPVYGFTCGLQADVRYLDLESMLSMTRELFYDEYGFEETFTRSATRSAFLALHRKFCPAKPMVVRLAGEDDFAEATQRFMRDAIGASERFLWSYAANFRKLVFPLLQVGGESADLRHVSRCLAGGRGRLLNTLAQRDAAGMKAVLAATSRPGYLAMIYAMAEATDTQREALFERMMDPQTIEKLSLGQRLADGMWLETGGATAMACPDAADEVVALIATGMLEADPERGRLAVTPKASRLVENLPDECNDPDWKLRLFQPDGSIPNTLSVNADAWIEGFFGKIASNSVLAA